MTNTTSPAKLVHREKAQEALKLRRDSAKTWQEITDELGYSSPQAAQRAVARLANRIETKDVESYRKKINERLDWLWDQVEERLVNGDRNSMGFAQTVNAAKAILDRQAKLHGVDAAIKVEVTEVTRSAIDAEIEELAGKIKSRAAGQPVPSEPTAVDLTKRVDA
jgi:hypothetical protein